MNHRLPLCSLLLLSIPLSVLFFPRTIRAIEPSPDTAINPSPVVSTSPRPVISEPLNLTISPVTINLETKPGETVSTTLKVRNNGTSTERLRTSLGSFVADETGQQPKLIDPDPNSQFLQWLTISEPNFEVPPNEWKTVQITFSPPASAALSYYYTIYLQREAGDAVAPGEAKIEGSPAILVLTNVISPQAKRELQLEKVAVTHSFLEFLPQQLSLTITNTGNVHTIPQGNIFIDGQGQKDLAVLSINPGNNSILPQSSRTFTIDWNDGFPVWDPDATYGLKWDFNQASHFRFGKYTAHVVLVYDNGERDVPIESFVSFWIIPWKLILVGIAIPVVPALLVFLLMKWKYGQHKTP